MMKILAFDFFRSVHDEKIYKQYPGVYRDLFFYFINYKPDATHPVSPSVLNEKLGIITRNSVIQYILDRVSWAAEISANLYAFVDDTHKSQKLESDSTTVEDNSQADVLRKDLFLTERVQRLLKRETAGRRFGVSALYLKHFCGNPDVKVLEQILNSAEWARQDHGMYLYVESMYEDNVDHLDNQTVIPDSETDNAAVPQGTDEIAVNIDQADNTSELEQLSIFEEEEIDIPIEEPEESPEIPEKSSEISEEPSEVIEESVDLTEPETETDPEESTSTLAERYHLEPAAYQTISIEELGLSVRAHHCLRRANVKTAADLLELNISELKTVRNLGQKTIQEIMECISRLPARIQEPEKLTDSTQQPDLCLSRLKNQILHGHFNDSDFQNLSDSDAHRLCRLREVYDCLNDTGILEQLNDDEHITVYRKILFSLSDPYTQCCEIRKMIEEIPPKRRCSSVWVYADVYVGNDPEKGRLLQLLDDGIDDKSFYNLTSKAGTFSPDDLEVIRTFLAWCAYDLFAEIEKVTGEIIHNERARKIVKLRADGYTLDQIGIITEVTKGRISQQEAKICRRFTFLESQNRLMDRIAADLGGVSVFTSEEVSRLCGQDVDEFLDLAKINTDPHYSYDARRGLFIIGDGNSQQDLGEYPASEKTELSNELLYHYIPNLREYVQKLEREFRLCIYVGDIVVDDEGYALLCQALKMVAEQHYSHDIYYSSIVISVALVQIGLRKYDGRFWPHVEEVLGVKMDGSRQRWLGRCFYYTLEKYGKFRMDIGEMMNNILLHCFVTDHYADDLFDFLLAYYRIDLGRDLYNNTEERMDYLIQSMKNAEHSARSYKIKKHTADAATANEEECRKRINMVLNYIDAGFFRQEYPTDSINRIAKLFCQWEDRTKSLEYSRKKWTPSAAKGVKQYRSPHLQFNGRSEQFELILPEQYVRLEDEDELPGIYWMISVNGRTHSVDTEPENGVTGCETNRLSIPFENPQDIFSRITVTLFKEECDLSSTVISENPVRFFDMSGQSLTIDGYLTAGEACAFLQEGHELLVSEQALMGKEIHAGLLMQHLDLVSGDVIRLPSGKALPIGKPLDEGVMNFAKVSGVYVIEGEEQLPLFRAVPNIFFRMNCGQEAGTRILINGVPERLHPDSYTRYEDDNSGDETGYTLVLQSYIEESGIYSVVIDVPNSQKRREYRFAYIEGFNYQFSKPVYIFEDCGSVSFGEGYHVDCYNDDVVRDGSNFIFPIISERDELSFSICTDSENLQLRVYLPVFQWRFDEGEWKTEKPEELWHLEFPKLIYLKYPEDEVEFSMPPALLRTSDEEAREPVRFSAAFFKDKEKHLFICDTRKMLSWLGFEEPIRLLSITFSDERIPFVNVITRCYLPNKRCTIEEKYGSGELIFRTSILGFADCKADIFRDEEQIADKLPITTGGIRVRCPFISGDYRIDFYEENEEDDFGLEEYRKFDSVTCHYENRNDLRGKSIAIKGIREYKQSDSIFAAKQYPLAESYLIEKLDPDSVLPEKYNGNLNVDGIALNVAVEFREEGHKKAYITYYDAEEECYVDFFYDPVKKMIRTDECPGPMLDPDKQYFEIRIM